MTRKLWQRIGAIALLVSVGSLGMQLSASAQSATSVDPLEGLDGSAGSGDPFSENGSGQASSLMQLLNQIQTTNGGSPEAQRQQNRYEIQTGAEAFRQRQLQILNGGGMTPAEPSLDETDPAVTTETPE